MLQTPAGWHLLICVSSISLVTGRRGFGHLLLLWPLASQAGTEWVPVLSEGIPPPWVAGRLTAGPLSRTPARPSTHSLSASWHGRRCSLLTADAKLEYSRSILKVKFRVLFPRKGFCVRCWATHCLILLRQSRALGTVALSPSPHLAQSS